MDWNKQPDADYWQQQELKRGRDERWLSRQQRWPALIGVAVVLLIVAAFVIATAYATRNAEPLEKQTLKAAKVVCVLLSDFFQEHLTAPLSLSEMEAYGRTDLDWPLNPYTQQPMAETGSRDFDPATFPGNIHFEPLYRDEVIIGWKLYVFGVDGELHCYQTIYRMED